MTGELAKALAQVQAALPVVHKGKKANVGQYSYTYADLSDVTAAIMPLLTKHGLSFTCTPRATERGYELAGILMHSSGESIEGALPLQSGTPQQVGSALTYARRYLISAMTGVVTDDDDDAQAATAAAKEARREVHKQAAEEAVPRISETQTKRLHALLREAAIEDRDKKIQLAEWYVRKHSDGRAIESTSELTTREASGLIDYLVERIASDKAAKAAHPQEVSA